jgi:hypothetical protein
MSGMLLARRLLLAGLRRAGRLFRAAELKGVAKALCDGIASPTAHLRVR